MKQIAFLFILTTLLLGSCTPATASPTQPVVDPVTPTITPSQTPPPTPSAIPTVMPYPALHTQGPYLLFTRDNKSLTIMDADGSGRKQIQLSNDGYIGWHFSDAISPNGKWIAYFTGSKDEPYDLTLNLLNLKDETTLSISKLIAPGFPQNLEPVAKTLKDESFGGECTDTLKCKMEETEDAFREGIDSLRWSPDSQFLAFAAQIDGPSSDIYIYEVSNNSIRRLTKEPENIFYIHDWSPGGEKLLYDTSIPGTIYIGHTLHIANPQSESVQDPRSVDTNGSFFWGGLGWMTDNLYFISDLADGCCPHNFRYLDISNQHIREIWKYPLEKFSILSDLHGMAFSIYEDEADYYQIPFEAGTYFLPIDGKLVKLANEVYLPEESGFTDSFFAEKDGNLYSIKVDGSGANLVAESIGDHSFYQISPDKKWLLIETNNKLELYSETLQLIKSWDIYSAGILWRPDSLGAFLIVGKELHYLSIPNGEPVFVGYCSDTYCTYPEDFVWLP